MTTLSYTIPVAGSTLNSIADPQIATALQTIQTWANGNIDPTNIKAVIPSGLLGARPAAGAASGAFYYATDSGLLYWSSGSAWTTVASPAGAGAWQALTLGTNVVAFSGTYTPQARINVDRVELRGAIQNGSGGTISGGATLFTVPASCKPASQVLLNTLQGRGAAVTVPYPLSIASITGIAVSNWTGDSSLASGAVISLDGLSYSLS